MNISELFRYLDSENKWKNDFSMLHFESYEIAESRLHTMSAKSENNRYVVRSFVFKFYSFTSYKYSRTLRHFVIDIDTISYVSRQ